MQIEDTPAFENEQTDVKDSLSQLLDGVKDGSLKARTTRRVENSLEFVQDFVKQDGQTFVVAVLLLVVSVAVKGGYTPSWLRLGRKSSCSSEAQGQQRTQVDQEESKLLGQKKVL